MTRLPVLVALAALGSLAGCQSSLLKRPPTPAAALTREQLEAEPVPEGERYYVLLFGSESVPKRAVLTHTWATVVRVAPPGTAGSLVEAHTISWMPRTLAIRPFRFSVEPGVNLDLAATMRLVTGLGERVTLYGPYEVPVRVYRRLLVQKAFMEGGTVGYQGFDLIGEAGRRGNGSNCIHAVTDVDPELGRSGYLLSGNGSRAGDFIRDRMTRRGIIGDPAAAHDWLLPTLGSTRRLCGGADASGSLGFTPGTGVCPLPSVRTALKWGNLSRVMIVRATGV